MADRSRIQLPDRSLIFQAAREGQGIVESGLLDLIEFYILQREEREGMNEVVTPLSKTNPVSSQADAAVGTTKIANGSLFRPPVAYWDFKEGTGTAINDQSDAENEIDGVTNGSPGWDGPSKSLIFDGVDDWVNLTNSALFEMKSNFSITAWLKTSAVAAIAILARADSGTVWGAGAKEFYMDTDGTLGYGDFGATPVTTSGSINDGAWHHVALTMDVDGSVRIYIDGVLDNTAILTPAAPNAAHIVNIQGVDKAAANQKETAYWDYVLTPEHVAALYNSGVPASANAAYSSLV